MTETEPRVGPRPNSPSVAKITDPKLEPFFEVLEGCGLNLQPGTVLYVMAYIYVAAIKHAWGMNEPNDSFQYGDWAVPPGVDPDWGTGVRYYVQFSDRFVVLGLHTEGQWPYVTVGTQLFGEELVEVEQFRVTADPDAYRVTVHDPGFKVVRRLEGEDWPVKLSELGLASTYPSGAANALAELLENLHKQLSP